MAKLDIIVAGNPVLRLKAKEVERIDKKTVRLLNDMAETMYAADGVGLAAPQVGVSRRIVVIDVGEGLIELINPVITKREGSVVGGEGCLSVPGLRGLVPRWRHLRYTGFDPFGTPIDRVVDGFHARVVQHECDHLDGVLYPSRIRDFRCFGFTEELFPDAALAPED